MAAGKMDRRIRLERATRAPNAANELIETWATLATVWAEHEPLSDGERYRAGQVGATATARFRIRYSSTVAALGPLDRLVYDGDVYEIHGVKEVGRRVMLEITAAKRAE